VKEGSQGLSALARHPEIRRQLFLRARDAGDRTNRSVIPTQIGFIDAGVKATPGSRLIFDERARKAGEEQTGQ
jgi:hypothetical protein